MKWSSVAFGSVVALLGLAASSSAGPIIGHIGFSGGIVYDTRGANTGLSILDFYNTDGVTPGVGTGQVLKIGGATGYFAAVDAGSTATIKDITNDPTAQPPATLVPDGVSFYPVGIANILSNFSDLDVAGLHFDLTELLTAQGPACTGAEGVGNTCVEGPFTLLGTANGVRVNFDVLGFFRAPGDEGYFKGSFSTTFNGLTFAELFNRLDNTGADLMCGVNNLETSCTMDANFDPTAVPEPASLLTFGAGAALLAMVRRRRAANKA